MSRQGSSDSLPSFGDGGGNALFTRDDIHDMFMSMINAQIGTALSTNAPPPTSTFTARDQEELAQLVQEQMKRAVESRKRALQQQQRTGIYTLLTRESLETYRQINQAAVTIAALGAGFTFTIIFSDLSEPRADFSKDDVKTALAVAWLLFVLTIILASFAAAMQSMRESVVIPVLFIWRIVYGACLLGAFVASAEAVRAYQSAVGITALALIGILAISALLVSLRAKWLVRRRRRGRV
jgi:hypothetical protein